MARREADSIFTTAEAINELSKMGFTNPSRRYLGWYFDKEDSIRGVRWISKFDLQEVKLAFIEGQIFERLDIYGSLKIMGVRNCHEYFLKIKDDAREILSEVREVSYAS